MSRPVYIYEDFSGFNLELYSHELSEDKLYDIDTDEYRKLLDTTSDVSNLEKLCSVYGFSPNTHRYKELIRLFKEISDGRVDSSEIE